MNPLLALAFGFSIIMVSVAMVRKANASGGGLFGNVPGYQQVGFQTPYYDPMNEILLDELLNEDEDEDDDDKDSDKKSKKKRKGSDIVKDNAEKSEKKRQETLKKHKGSPQTEAQKSWQKAISGKYAHAYQSNITPFFKPEIITKVVSPYVNDHITRLGYVSEYDIKNNYKTVNGVSNYNENMTSFDEEKNSMTFMSDIFSSLQKEARFANVR